MPAISISPGNHLDIRKSEAVALKGITVPYSNIQSTQSIQKDIGNSYTNDQLLDTIRLLLESDSNKGAASELVSIGANAGTSLFEMIQTNINADRRERKHAKDPTQTAKRGDTKFEIFGDKIELATEPKRDTQRFIPSAKAISFPVNHVVTIVDAVTAIDSPPIPNINLPK